MDDRIRKIGESLGASHVARLPEVGPGAFGAARLASLFETLLSGLEPSPGLRTGRPTNPNWTRRSKVPMSDSTEVKLAALAERASTRDRKVSPMQVAAQLLEDRLAEINI